ncbi:Peptidase propeptide and YPEB domain-containing protein [Gracilibacillus ureilyticus]|uniref:Peptidase propeptide and YPEB domain-containing protein n=1 Tax=Gracilibacillus ureilyticus TaxID=531814 RepID=A0A1H9VKC3_9BACI|nr:PepSY domain-containing protein [Gracilibacillus ureilyticus]SES22034.1 Peptidase propeptide and YPEB domain-containing protein [Gracilibacillus ureilyticus]
MKNKRFFITLTSLLVVGIVLAILQFTPDSASAYLSRQEAEDKVKTQFPGEIVELELEEDDNRKVYEIEIRGTEMHYDLKLDAETGKILKLEEKPVTPSESSVTTEKNSENTNEDNKDDSDTKADSTDKNNTTSEQSTSGGGNNPDDQKDSQDDSQPDNKTETLISAEKAKSIALEQHNGTITDFELDEDDGRMLYEMEIHTATNEVDIEIDAYTGSVISISVDDLDD